MFSHFSGFLQPSGHCNRHRDDDHHVGRRHGLSWQRVLDHDLKDCGPKVVECKILGAILPNFTELLLGSNLMNAERGQVLIAPRYPKAPSDVFFG